MTDIRHEAVTRRRFLQGAGIAAAPVGTPLAALADGTAAMRSAPAASHRLARRARRRQIWLGDALSRGR